MLLLHILDVVKYLVLKLLPWTLGWRRGTPSCLVLNFLSNGGRYSNQNR